MMRKGSELNEKEDKISHWNFSLGKNIGRSNIEKQVPVEEGDEIGRQENKMGK